MNGHEVNFEKTARDRRQMTFWRDYSGNEVDFIIGDKTAIEVKSSNMVKANHLKGLKLISEKIPFLQKFVVSQDSRPREIDGIRVLPWKKGRLFWRIQSVSNRSDHRRKSPARSERPGCAPFPEL